MNSQSYENVLYLFGIRHCSSRDFQLNILSAIKTSRSIDHNNWKDKIKENMSNIFSVLLHLFCLLKIKTNKQRKKVVIGLACYDFTMLWTLFPQKVLILTRFITVHCSTKSLFTQKVLILTRFITVDCSTTDPATAVNLPAVAPNLPCLASPLPCLYRTRTTSCLPQLSTSTTATTSTFVPMPSECRCA